MKTLPKGDRSWERLSRQTMKGNFVDREEKPPPKKKEVSFLTGSGEKRENFKGARFTTPKARHRYCLMDRGKTFFTLNCKDNWTGERRKILRRVLCTEEISHKQKRQGGEIIYTLCMGSPEGGGTMGVPVFD